MCTALQGRSVRSPFLCHDVEPMCDALRGPLAPTPGGLWPPPLHATRLDAAEGLNPLQLSALFLACGAGGPLLVSLSEREWSSCRGDKVVAHFAKGSIRGGRARLKGHVRLHRIDPLASAFGHVGLCIREGHVQLVNASRICHSCSTTVIVSSCLHSVLPLSPLSSPLGFSFPPLSRTASGTDSACTPGHRNKTSGRKSCFKAC